MPRTASVRHPTPMRPGRQTAVPQNHEDERDLAAYRRAKRAWARSGKKTVPWSKIKKDLDL